MRNRAQPPTACLLFNQRYFQKARAGQRVRVSPQTDLSCLLKDQKDADTLKVVETSNKDDGRTVEKIKGVNLIRKEAGCRCRPHVSEERSQISSARGKLHFFHRLLLPLGSLAYRKVSFGVW